MALHYDTTKIQQPVNYDYLDYLIWATIPIGISKITEKNWKEFYLRLDYLHRLTLKPHDYVKYSDIFTPKLIKNCIGLRTDITNAGLQHCKNESLAKFKNRIFKSYQRDTINSI